MAYKVKQFRYYDDDCSDPVADKRNQPTRLNDDDSIPIKSSHYVNGDVFGACFPVSQLGVQALPGTKFYLNDSVDPIIIGTTGIYELDLDNGIQITKIKFDGTSMSNIKENRNAFLIVDIIYDDGED